MMNLDKEQIDINEIYSSIQGEGRYVGYPSIFIRTTGCNLRCQWDDTLCDTPQTSWYPEINKMAISETINKVKSLHEKQNFIKSIVITGGEPLLQKNLDILIVELKKMEFFITVETNGTVARPICTDFLSISPKLKSSTPLNSKFTKIHERKRYNIEALSFWLKHYSYQLKFVINDLDNDENEILAILSDLNVTNRENVYLMPQGITSEQLRLNAKKCISVCMDRGWIFTPRIHIDIFGNKKGT